MAGWAKVPQTLVAQTEAGPAINTFTTFTRIIRDEDVVPVGAPAIAKGMLIEIDMLVNVSNKITTVPTFQFQIKLGGVVAWTSDALPTKATASVALPALLSIKLRVDSIGKTNAAKVIGSGNFQGAAFNPTSGMLQAASLAVGTGFGSTADDGSANLDIGAVCSASDAANGLQVMFYRPILTWYP